MIGMPSEGSQSASDAVKSPPLPVARYVVVTAGHVDHGKTALVRALTGIDTDRLPEEKRRGITVDLGFAHFEMTDARGKLDVGVVDVPGHEDFVRNMVAGVGAVDAALLVVAADDGWMPQTEEHLQILEYLGVGRAVVAVTKSDRSDDVAGAVDRVRNRLVGSAFASAAIVPVSVRSGSGLDDLRSALAAVLRESFPVDAGSPRMWVDRVFTLRGVGTVATGTLTGGAIRAGHALHVRPASVVARVRGIQVHNRAVDRAEPGSRVALNLPDADIRRGDLLTAVDAPAVTEATAVVWRTTRLVDPPPLRNQLRAWLHVGTRSTPVRLGVRADEAGVLLRFDSPQPVSIGDRFVLRDWSAQSTLAGGSVTGLSPKRPWPRVAHPAGITQLIADAVESAGSVDVASWTARSRFGPAQVAVAIASMTAVAAGGLLIDPKRWAEAVAAMQSLVDAVHHERPQSLGCDVAKLRETAADLLPAFDDLLAALIDRGFVRRGSTVARVGFRPELPAALRAAGALVRSALSTKPLAPENRNEVAPTAAERSALQYLLDTGEAVAVGPELVLSADAVAAAVGIVRERIGRQGRSSMSELRQVLGTTRRVAVPLLEYLDRQHVTKRVGDGRELV